MHLKHTCLPISPPEQGLKLPHSISYLAAPRKGATGAIFSSGKGDLNYRLLFFLRLWYHSFCLKV